MPFRVHVDCTEFGLSMTAGQLDPRLSIAQLNALAVSGLGDWVGSSGQDAPTPPAPIPVAQVEPITSLMLANPVQFGLVGGAGRVFEHNGLLYGWDRVAQGLRTLGGWTADQVAGLTVGRLVDAQGGVRTLSGVVEEVQAIPSAATQILAGPGLYSHYRCTVAAGEITVYDGTSSSGAVLVSTRALEVGLWPIFGPGDPRCMPVTQGIRAVLTGPAEVYVGMERG